MFQSTPPRGGRLWWRAAIAETFRHYAAGSASLSALAAWLNGKGFRTRNTKALPDPDGNLVAGPRLFTTASVRGILHNPFYAGLVRHRGGLLPGAHEALRTKEVFDLVQATLKKNCGRSETLQQRPEREYLLQGLIRCGYCGMPMWAQTYKSGQQYYREHRGVRSLQECPSRGGAILCRIPDEQMGRIVQAITLPDAWLGEVLARISLKDVVERVKKEQRQVQERLRRMARAYVDGLLNDGDYQRQKRLLELDLEGLVVPQANAAEEAGRLVTRLPELWAGACLGERRKLLASMLDGVYIDAKEDRAIVGIKPKPPFLPVFQVAVAREGSGVVLIKEPPEPNGSGASRVPGGDGGGPLSTHLHIWALLFSRGFQAKPLQVVVILAAQTLPCWRLGDRNHKDSPSEPVGEEPLR